MLLNAFVDILDKQITDISHINTKYQGFLIVIDDMQEPPYNF